MKDERVEEEGDLHLQGIDLDQLLDMNNEQLVELFVCRIRRKFSRGLKRKPMALIKKLRKKKKETPAKRSPMKSRPTSDDWTLLGRILHLLQTNSSKSHFFTSSLYFTHKIQIPFLQFESKLPPTVEVYMKTKINIVNFNQFGQL